MYNLSLQWFQKQTFHFNVLFDLSSHPKMKKFRVNDFVWAKLYGHRYWPAIIMEPDPDVPRRASRNYGGDLYWVLFFGTHDHAWVADRYIKEYRVNKHLFASQTKGVSFMDAILEIEEHIDRAKNDPSYFANFKVIKKLKTRRRSRTPGTNVIVNNRIEINENLPPAETCYGVLGTGTIGATIVNSLIKVGKKVYIWNRTKKKCEKLVEKLDHSDQSNLKICLSPRLVMQHSHIIFNCVSDCQVSKTIIERTLAQSVSSDTFMQGKGLVDMSGIDPESTKALSKLVNDSGGKYLEVRIQHGKNEGIGGGYLFLVGGNEDLYKACENCFYSFGGTPFHFRNEEVGYVTKMNLVLQLIKSVFLVGLAEGYSLIERLAPQNSQEKLLRIMLDTPFACDYFQSKAIMIFQKNFTLVEQSMQDLGQDIRFGLEMSNHYSQPMYLTTLAHQIFKHCQKLGYGDKDPSAIFLRVRH